MLLMLFLYPIEVINKSWFTFRRLLQLYSPGVTLIVILLFVRPYCRELHSFSDIWLYIGEFNVWFRVAALFLCLVPYALLLFFIPYNWRESGVSSRGVLHYAFVIQVIGIFFILFMLTGLTVFNVFQLTAAMCVKTEEELACIRKACEIAEAAYTELLGLLKEGMSENETAGLLEYLMRKHGAFDRSFETIAAFGKNTSVPHHASCGDKLAKGMPVLLDFGCVYGGYCSDITRTFLFGDNGDTEFKEVYGRVLEAHMLAAEGIRAQMTGIQADAFARDHLKKYGLDKFFTHSLGHGIGVNIHEAPYLSARSGNILADGMVFSIEPGVYFEGKVGIRIEDSVTLENGRVQSLMKTDKRLTVL